ncbi:hypothetical protein [Agrobacterium vitis]|uniref:hypothetical protein n=1 Tax=Agrobacterium vitis TaxID=373 RepID=UPI001F3ED969|nr:hypothetical protein [Agrobacterium vitis]
MVGDIERHLAELFGLPLAESSHRTFGDCRVQYLGGLRRMKLLEEASIIFRYVAVLDQMTIGLTLSMFAHV